MMNHGEVLGSRTDFRDADGRMLSSPTRFYALDSVRATAMLLGVFYHLPIAFMAGGFGMGFGFGASPKTSVDNWLHSFRMPLFFLISGFFANMMLGKYGTKRYLARRWCALARRWPSRYLRSPVYVSHRAISDRLDPHRLALRQHRSPDLDRLRLGSVRRPVCRPLVERAAGVTRRALHRSAGPPADLVHRASHPARTRGRVCGAGQSPFGSPNMAALAPPTGPPKVPSRTLADAIFGKYSQYFNLEHLWFLWYLLVFVTVGPLAAMAFAGVFSRSSSDTVDRLGRGLIRFNVMVLALGLVSLPVRSMRVRRLVARQSHRFSGPISGFLLSVFFRRTILFRLFSNRLVALPPTQWFALIWLRAWLRQFRPLGLPALRHRRPCRTHTRRRQIRRTWSGSVWEVSLCTAWAPRIRHADFSASFSD